VQKKSTFEFGMERVKSIHNLKRLIEIYSIRFN
jgi:hypothetical protein